MLFPNTILQINKYHYIRRGAERYYFNLSDLLRERGHQVVHFSMHDQRNLPSEYAKYFVSNMDIFKTHFNLSGLRKALRMVYSRESKKNIEALLRDTKPRVAHIHNIYHQLSPSVLSALRKYHIPAVMSLHDYKLITPNYTFLCKEKICEHRHWYQGITHRSVKDSYVASAWCELEKFIHDRWGIYHNAIDLFLAPSEFIKNKFIEYGFNEQKIKVLPYTLNLKEYSEARSPSDYILYFGSLSKEKGIEVLLDAMTEVKNSVTLKIVGEGPLENALKAKVKKRKMSQIEFLGYLAGDALREMANKSMCVIVPSVWYENSPLVIYEAMALGKPVIGSRIGGIPELVKENVTGLLFEAGNSYELASKIDYLIQNKDMIEQMGRAAKAESLRFGFDTHYEEIMEVYRNVMEKYK